MPEAATPTVEILLGLLLITFVVAVIVQRVRLPYTVALVLTGLGLGFVPGIGAIQLTHGLILTVFLPVLLFEGAYNVPVRRLRRNFVPITLLAVPGVALGMGITAAIVHYVLGLSWPVALVFGALISATDPVAVLAMFRELGAPRRLGLIVEGESLFNDGTAFTLFQIVLAGIVTGQFDLGQGVVQFVVTVVGALIVGSIIGYVGSLLLRTVDNYQIEITATVVAAYGSYIVADHLGVSGVIATVVTGLFFGNYGSTTGVSPRSVFALDSTWEFLGFVANSLIFLLIGIELDPRRFASIWWYVLIAFVAAMVARALVVYLLTPLVRGELRIPVKYRHALLWGGLRGALSLALALSLPLTIHNGSEPFPDRALVQLMTFGVVGISLLLQGLTMGPLIHWLGLTGDTAARDQIEVLRGRLVANEAALDQLGRQRERGLVRELEYERLYRSYQRQHDRLSRQLERLEDTASERPESPEEAGRPEERAAQAEKAAVQSLYDKGEISEETLDALESEIDRRLTSSDSEQPSRKPRPADSDE